MTPNELLQGLPGEPLIREGLADVEAGRLTIPACLVAMAGPRLRRAGLMRTDTGERVEAERTLYRLLRAAGGDAYSMYNALLRELVSFEQALDHRLSRQHQEQKAGMET